MRINSIAVILLSISLTLTVWLIIGSFVTYTPAISANDIQNIYIGRIVRLGSAIGLLQAGAIAVWLISSKKT